MKIRKAKLTDLETVTKAAVDLLKYHSKFDPYFAPAKNVNAVYNKFFKKCIYSKNRYLIVAEEYNKIIGYALGELGSRPPVFKLRKIGFINDVYVDKNHRKMGIAKLFLSELYKWFKRKKLEHIELTVHPKNEGARRAWEKYGFKEYMIKQRKGLGKI